MANEISLEWVEDLRFEGHAGNARVAIDGNSQQGTSPVDLLLQSVGSCTAADVVDILRKGRQELTGMTVQVSAERRDEHPRSVKRLVFKFRIRGPVEETKARRAVDLSLEKYCSVFHSLRFDITLDTEIVIEN